MIGDAGEDVGEPGLRIDIDHFCRDDERVHDSGALTATVGSSGVKVLLIVVSAVQAGVNDPVSWFGVATVVVTLCAYSYLTLHEKPKPPPADTGGIEAATTAGAKTEQTPLIKP